ncbi:hypothetical protein GCM10009733_008100 [Nonomuraea maheshkhaliensis]|uniref:Uncharacterized protein n=1 Tax=Nonomuraea maheshkhaliensis TaxID=419590 RepID=A0ABN2EQ50_9ACTN
MIEIEDGYEVAYDLALVLAHAEAAVAADPHAALDLATDGSCLRFTADDPVVICAQDQAALPDDVIWMRLDQLTWRAGKSDSTLLEMMRDLKADGGIRLRFMWSPCVRTSWIMTGNPRMDQRRPPYDVPERYMVLSMTSPTHYAIIDLEKGLPYRQGPGRSGMQAGLEDMRALCARLNAEATCLTSSESPPACP